MQGFMTMLKLNLKMLLRNKGYLISVIGIPLLSLSWIWFINYSSDVASIVTKESKITELEWQGKALQSEDKLELAVKVYDASHSKVSDYFLQELVKYSMFNLYHIDATGKTMEEMKEEITDSANHSNLFTAIYLPENFEELLIQGSTTNVITLFLTSEDGRGQLLKTNCRQLLSILGGYGEAAGHSKDQFYTMLSQAEKLTITKQVTKVSESGDAELTEAQKREKDAFGYVLAFFSLSFLLSGVFISSIYVKEKNNNVMKRITLTKASFFNYMAVKIVLAILTLVIEEVVILGGISILGDHLGLSAFQFVFTTSGVGIILLLLAITVGMYTDNVVTVAYGGFFAWTISNCLAGLYFPLTNSSSWMQALSKLMPQYWSIRLYNMFITGVNGGILMYTAVTLAFLAFLGCLGVLGLKLTSKK